MKTKSWTRSPRRSDCKSRILTGKKSVLSELKDNFPNIEQQIRSTLLEHPEKAVVIFPYDVVTPSGEAKSSFFVYVHGPRANRRFSIFLLLQVVHPSTEQGFKNAGEIVLEMMRNFRKSDSGKGLPK